MVRWLEANGYDVSYITGVDTDRARRDLLRSHKVFLSVGHDEYWSGAQRANVEAARDAGVQPGVLQRQRGVLEDALGDQHRRLEHAVPHAGLLQGNARQREDRSRPPTWTGTWRDPRFSPPADGGRPENALTGTIFMVNDGAHDVDHGARGRRQDALLAQHQRRHARGRRSRRRCRPARSATSGTRTLDNGFRPAGPDAPVDDDGHERRRDAAGLRLDVRHRHRDAQPDALPRTAAARWSSAPARCSGRGASTRTTTAAARAADAAHAAGDGQPVRRHGRAAGHAAAGPGRRPRHRPTRRRPTSTITSPAAGATFAAGHAVTISGTATDTGGGVVGGVEVSVDGGATWHPATGRDELDLHLDAAGGSARSRSGAARSTTAATWKRRARASPSRSAAMPDTTAPTVSAASPANNATGVAAPSATP